MRIRSRNCIPKFILWESRQTQQEGHRYSTCSTTCSMLMECESVWTGQKGTSVFPRSAFPFNVYWLTGRETASCSILLLPDTCFIVLSGWKTSANVRALDQTLGFLQTALVRGWQAFYLLLSLSFILSGKRLRAAKNISYQTYLFCVCFT